MATTQVILTRHAEKVRDGSADPGLTDEGRARARALGEHLRDLRVEVGAAFCSDLRRTRQTAEEAIAAGRLGVTVQVVSSPREVVARIRARPPADELILVVHHVNTVPEIANLLGVSPEQDELDDRDFEQLWTVVLTEPVTLRKGRHPARTPARAAR